MFEQIGSMFADMENMLKKLKKKTYEQRMKEFRDRNAHYFEEMTAFVDAAEDKEAACKELADCFTEAVYQHFQVKGKIKGRTQADMNFYMIYYVFPSILLTDHASAKEIADAVCSAWGAKFKDSKIGYTTYDSLYGAFKEKIFGIF